MPPEIPPIKPGGLQPPRDARCRVDAKTRAALRFFDPTPIKKTPACVRLSRMGAAHAGTRLFAFKTNQYPPIEEDEGKARLSRMEGGGMKPCQTH